MINNKKYCKTIQEMERVQNERISITNVNYKHYPYYIVKESEIDYASYIEFYEHNPFGVLHIFTEKPYKILNVFQYFLFVITPDNKIIPAFSDSDILEISDLKNFYLVCTHPTATNPQKIGTDQIVSCDLNLYHIDNLLHTIHNVQRIDKVGVDLRIIYTSCESQNIYRHWVYKNGTSELLLKDNLQWTSESQNSSLVPGRYTNICNKQGMLEIVFHEMSCKSCLILKEFSKTLDGFEILPNVFDDDATLNYKILIQEARLDDIAFVQYCLMKNTELGNYAIYDIPLSSIAKGCRIPPSPQKVLNELSKLQLSNEEEMFYVAIVDMIFDKYNKENDYYFPAQFIYKDMTHVFQLRALTDFLNKNHPAFIQFRQGNRKVFNSHLSEMKLLYDNIYDQLIANRVIIPKWKSEYSLYELVKKKYPTTIYQYRTQWLGRQSLDIFIPELLTAIEYQGVQHFKPVEIFGGKEHFEIQQRLDEQKRILCKSNNVHLIEWKYDEPISSLMLKNKLSEL